MNEVLSVLERARDKISEKKSSGANLLKHAFRLYKARAAFRASIFQVFKFQRWWRMRKILLAEKRSQMFFEAAVESIIRFKSDLRRDREVQTAKVILDTCRKKKVLDIVKNGLRYRRITKKTLKNLAMVLKFRKMYFAISLQRMIVDKAWRRILRKSQLEGAITMQRMFRGFLARQKKRTQVLQAETIRTNTLKDKAARLLQKHARGKIIRDRLEVLRQAVLYIQGFIKARWLNQLFRTMRAHVIRVQRAVRRFLIRKKAVNGRISTYLQKELGLLRNQQAVENAWFFAPPAGSDPLPRQPFFPSSAYDTTPLDAELSLTGPLGGTTDSLLLNDLQSEQEDPTRITPKLKEPGRTFLKAYTPYALKKITLFARVFDLQVLTDSSVVYNPCWAYQWESMFMDCIQKDSPLQVFAVGDSHTVAVNSASKAFTWGWNDEGQCGRPEAELTS